MHLIQRVQVEDKKLAWGRKFQLQFTVQLTNHEDLQLKQAALRYKITSVTDCYVSHLVTNLLNYWEH